MSLHGENESFLAVFDRYTENRPTSIDIERGWWPLIHELDSALASIDPDYTITEISEKNGLLRVYADCHPNCQREFNNILEKYEIKSSNICEFCGEKCEASGSKCVCIKCRHK